MKQLEEDFCYLCGYEDFLGKKEKENVRYGNNNAMLISGRLRNSSIPVVVRDFCTDRTGIFFTLEIQLHSKFRIKIRYEK